MYVYKNTPTFNINLFAWPAMNVLIWGFMNQYLSQTYGGQGVVAGTLIMGAVMWDVLMRSNWETIGFMYDDYASRSIAQIWASPIRTHEYFISLMIAMFPPTMMSFTMVSVLVYWLFDFSVLSVGWMLLLYVPLVMFFGWAIALFASIFIVRMGVGSASVIWFPIFIFASVSAMYYPLSALPPGWQDIALLFPPTYVMEHLRANMSGTPLPLSDLLWPAFLGIVWMGLAMFAFIMGLRAARVRGRILNVN
jgi:ABC-2 type transport system permease protein